MRVVSFAGALLLGSLLSAQGAAAATITTAINFIASNFTSSKGHVPAPISPVSGSFTLTFDPALIYSDETAGIVLNHIDIAASGVAAFSYDPNSGGTIGIGMDPFGAGGVLEGSNDFILSITTAPGVLDRYHFGYSQDGIVNFFNAQKLVLTTNPSLTPTPIPGSLLLLLTGLGAVGGIGFFRKRSTTAGAELAAA